MRWRLPEVDPRAGGSVTIANQPQMTRREIPAQGATRTALGDVGRTARKAAKKAAAPPVAMEFTPEVPAVTGDKKKKKKKEKGAPDDPSPPRPPPARPPPAHRLEQARLGHQIGDPIEEPPDRRVMKWIPGTGEEQDPERLAGNAYQLSQTMAQGIPAEFDVRYHTDVLDLVGVNLDDAVPAYRHPERVVIDPLTGRKHFPVLRFHKGSVTIVVGFRSRVPTIIAAYFAEGLARAAATQGGGGARKGPGVPRTVHQLVKALLALGCEFDTDADTPEVMFAGEKLGMVTIGKLRTKEQIETDYQRIQRKCHAIRARMATVN